MRNSEYANLHRNYFNANPTGKLYFRNTLLEYRVANYRTGKTTDVESSYESCKTNDYNGRNLCVLDIESYSYRWFSCDPLENKDYELIYDPFIHIDNLPVG